MTRKRRPEFGRSGPPPRIKRRTAPIQQHSRNGKARQRQIILIVILGLVAAALLIKRASAPAHLPPSLSGAPGSSHRGF